MTDLKPEDVVRLLKRLGEVKALETTMEVVRANSVFEHEFGIISQEEGFIPMQLPIPEGEKLAMRMTIICKATDAFIRRDVHIIHEDISWAKDTLIFKVAQYLVQKNPMGLTLNPE